MARIFRGRKPGRRRFFRSKLARKRRTWMQFNIDPCEPLEVPFCTPNDGCCTEQAKVVLLSNQELEDLYSDRCSVVRLLGDLWFFPRPGTITSQENLQEWIQYMQAYQAFVGLRRGEISDVDSTASFDIWAQNFDSLSEAQWMRTWQHVSHENFEQMVGNNLASGWTGTFPVRGSDTHTTFAGTNPEACSVLTSGTGNICIQTDMEDDCLDCGQALDLGQIGMASATARYPSAWHIHIDVKKKIAMRENQELYLMVNFRHFGQAGALPVDEGFWQIRGNVRPLIEMG